MKMKITYQGVAGAYSNIAAMQVFPEQDYLPCDTFEEAMGKVSAGEADLAMIPVENSNAGPMFIFCCRKPGCILSASIFCA